MKVLGKEEAWGIKEKTGSCCGWGADSQGARLSREVEEMRGYYKAKFEFGLDLGCHCRAEVE